jgi:hypothetical protein
VLQLLVCVLSVLALCSYCSNCNSYCLFVCLCYVIENSKKIGDKLWSSDEETLSNGVCGSGT